ncbi:MAG: hypothetical protein K6E18_04090, partial [Lachnospiraceae bacterium]|nr:hypothetical protein [Lachnospiraceae bacterium]
MNKDVWKKLRFFLFSLAILFLLPLQAKADTAPTKPTELGKRETRHHIFEAEKDEYGNIAYHPEDELIMPGDTFEFEVYQFTNENGKRSFFSLGYWGEATDEHAYTYDFESRSSLPGDAGFDVTSTKCVSVTNSQSITKAGGSQYTVPVKYINSSDYPVLLSLGFSGSMGEYGEWYLTVGLHVSYYKPYYGISYEGSNNDQLSGYHWDAGTYDSLEFPKYYWLTDVPYTIKVPNPTTTGSTFKGWSGTCENYCEVDGYYTKATVVYNAKAKPVYYGDTVNGTGDITFMPVFSGGSTIVFQGNGGTVNDRDSWILEATNTGTESNPVYTFNLAAVVPKKQGDTFLGWCYKESALYGSFVTKDDGKAAYDHFFSGSNYGSTIKTLYAKWASDTEETLEKNGWELSNDGTLWILNNDGVSKWATARET